MCLIVLVIYVTLYIIRVDLDLWSLELRTFETCAIVFHISSFASYTHLQVPQNLVLVERAPIPSSHPLLNMASGIVLKRPDPPVFSLPRDVLEEISIFRVNNKPPALRDVKSISQVYRHWREIVVGWPSLWGRAISLDELNQVRDD